MQQQQQGYLHAYQPNVIYQPQLAQLLALRQAQIAQAQQSQLQTEQVNLSMHYTNKQSKNKKLKTIFKFYILQEFIYYKTNHFCLTVFKYDFCVNSKCAQVPEQTQLQHQQSAQPQNLLGVAYSSAPSVAHVKVSGNGYKFNF